MLTGTSFSIAYGVIAGIISYVILNGFVWSMRKITGNRISPPNYDDDKELWVIPPGGIVPAWM